MSSACRDGVGCAAVRVWGVLSYSWMCCPWGRERAEETHEVRRPLAPEGTEGAGADGDVGTGSIGEDDAGLPVLAGLHAALRGAQVPDLAVLHAAPRSARSGPQAGASPLCSPPPSPREVAAGLEFGSSDPHCVGDVDRVPPRVRSGHPPFSAARLEAASQEELGARRLPVFNSCEPTGPPRPWEAAPPDPPVVRSVHDVVPAHTLALIASWVRRWKRSAAAAKRGNFMMAKALRPPDLVLDHAEHSVPATAPWDWDLRPLERGEPAKPLGLRRERPVHPINLEAVREASAWSVDEIIVDELEWGIRDDTRLPRVVLLCAPHLGALQWAAQSAAKLNKSVEEGWATRHRFLPAYPLRVCPFSVVDESIRAGKPKFRQTDDLSWPHPGMPGAPSSNDSMDRSRWRPVRHMSVMQLASAAAVLETVGVLEDGTSPVAVWGWDAVAFYRQMGRAVEECPRQVRVDLDGNFVYDERGIFGDAAMAAKACYGSDLIAQAVGRAIRQSDAEMPSLSALVRAWQSRRVAAAAALGEGAPESWVDLFVFGVYVDDGCGTSVNDLLWRRGEPVLRPDGAQMRRAEMHFRVARGVLERFGWRSEVSKEMWPSRRAVVLGLLVLLDERRVKLEGAKRERYASACEAMSGVQRARVSAFKALLGKLTFAAYVFPDGRQWLNPCWRALKVAMRAGLEVVVSSRVSAALSMWAAELRREGHVGVPLACREIPFPPWGDVAVSAIYADASGESGWSAWSVVRRLDGGGHLRGKS